MWGRIDLLPSHGIPCLKPCVEVIQCIWNEDLIVTGKWRCPCCPATVSPVSCKWLCTFQACAIFAALAWDRMVFIVLRDALLPDLEAVLMMLTTLGWTLCSSNDQDLPVLRFTSVLCLLHKLRVLLVGSSPQFLVSEPTCVVIHINCSECLASKNEFDVFLFFL